MSLAEVKESELKEFFGEVPRRLLVEKLANPVVSLSGVENLDAIPAKDESVSVRELDAFDHDESPRRVARGSGA